MRAARNSAVHMAVAFLAMGGWAVYANAAHPMPRPLIAGVAQGCVSALITLFLKQMLEALSQRLANLAALALPPIAAVLCSVALLLTIHGAAGTPEILRTIAVPLTVTAVYAATYNFALWKRRDG